MIDFYIVTAKAFLSSTNYQSTVKQHDNNQLRCDFKNYNQNCQKYYFYISSLLLHFHIRTNQPKLNSDAFWPCLVSRFIILIIKMNTLFEWWKLEKQASNPVELLMLYQLPQIMSMFSFKTATKLISFFRNQN